ncbi:NADH-quinone oxidoreductase subunit N [Nocardioides dokdonensis FR1436]|uniref:NADH-quinone oxidoreductase subunit N n=1 Tax=Nocardioides dokdonensis FR1436 TaxID=1300347 RepID=A0A1A9GS05_9ACTN|nr:proton-conducting transporter membrane subunit [Nocardioides dokdonensis]ANH40433.1 NADH-quinone oxidoreductase subunit N [Nocardioides dokdonensis FR1436]
MSMTSSVTALLPELVLLLGAVLCLLLGSWTPRLRQHRVRVVAGLVVLAFLGTAVLGLVRPSTTAFSATFTVDEATGLLRVVVGAALLVLLLLAGDEIAGHPRESEVYVLLLLGADGVLLVGGTTDLAVLVVGFLLASIPLYGLIGLSTTAAAPEAALKTYLIGALSGIVLMLGASVLFGLAGSTAYADLDAGIGDAPVAAGAAGVVLLLVGLLFKAGAVPAHFWVPDAVQGSWVTTAAFLTTVPKLGAVLAIARLLEALPRESVWPTLVAVLAAVSMTVGNLAALTQDDVRRLLGWSTISQVGYLLAVVAAFPGSELARPTLLLFLAAYAVTNLGCFAVLAAAPDRTRIDHWRGTARRRPGLVAALGVALLGLVGTPPTAVFVAKVLTIAVTWDAGLAWLAVLVAANTVLSLAYYLRWLAACISAPREQAEADVADPPGRLTSARLAYGCAVGAVALGLAAGPVLALAG